MASIRLLILLFVMPIACFAQSHILIKGRVTDAETGLPLEYANIAVFGKPIGTVSNTVGGFEFNIPAANKKDTLAASFIGYKSYKKCICDISGEELAIVLKPVAVELLNIIISKKPYTVNSLLQDVIEHYDDNYTRSLVAMEAFYRETRKADKDYGYLLEAAVNLYKESYRERYKAALQEVRVNAYSKKFDYETNENFLQTLLFNDYIADPYSGFFKRYSKKHEYIIEDTTIVDEEPVFVVSSGKLPDWKETYWINARNLAIIKFDGESYYGSDSTLVMSKPVKGKLSRYRHLKVVNMYSPLNGTYYPTYIRMVLDHDIFDVATRKSMTYKVLERELMISRVSDVDVQKPSETMQSISLETQLKKYNPEFWKNYNTLTRTPLQEQIVRDLEKEKSLEEQFEVQKAVKKGKKENNQ